MMRHIWLYWVASCVIGEALGIAFVSTTYAAIDRNLLTHPASWILAAGALEGLCLGTAQALVLRQINIQPLFWIVLTICGAVAGYASSLAGGAGAAEAEIIADPPLWLQVLLGASLGMAMGVLMGAVQWIAGRRKIALMPWIIANALGWAPAMAVIMFAAGSVERQWPLITIAFVGMAAGAIAGLSVGAVTGLVIMRAARAP